jgi:hypothetical protein
MKGTTFTGMWVVLSHNIEQKFVFVKKFVGDKKVPECWKVLDGWYNRQAVSEWF